MTLSAVTHSSNCPFPQADAPPFYLFYFLMLFYIYILTILYIFSLYFALFISLSYVFSLLRLIKQFHKIISTNNYCNAYLLNLIIYKSNFSCDFFIIFFFFLSFFLDCFPLFSLNFTVNIPLSTCMYLINQLAMESLLLSLKTPYS